MTNPLMLHRGGGTGGPPRGPRAGTQEWCDHRNANMQRNDIEWAMGPGGPYLRDLDWFTPANTKHIALKAEDERQRWIARQNAPRQFS